jgi:hypothetical protein
MVPHMQKRLHDMIFNKREREREEIRVILRAVQMGHLW